jgi:protein TonB
MKTIEKANKATAQAENLEDIIFEGRNQKYGAYTLRKNYNNNLLLSFLAVFIIANLIAGIPFLHSFMNPPVIKPDIIISIPCTPFSYTPPEQVMPPQPPPRLAAPPAAKTASENLPPEVVNDPVSSDPIPTVDENLVHPEPPVIPPVIAADPAPTVVVDDPNKTYDKDEVSTQAMFKDGSVDNFRKWLAKNMYYPTDALDNDVKGTVFLKFTIDKSGKICNITIVRSLHPILDQLAINTLKTSPKWTAATIKGKPVNVSYILPIAFNIQR